MDTKDILYHLRTERDLSQDELAAKIFVTRQAVSRWETGETTPNVETLKLLSAFFNVSINTLLGSPRQLICNAAACRLKIPSPVKSRTAPLTRTTACGAMPTEPSNTPRKSS